MESSILSPRAALHTLNHGSRCSHETIFLNGRDYSSAGPETSPSLSRYGNQSIGHLIQPDSLAANHSGVLQHVRPACAPDLLLSLSAYHPDTSTRHTPTSVRTGQTGPIYPLLSSPKGGVACHVRLHLTIAPPKAIPSVSIKDSRRRQLLQSVFVQIESQSPRRHCASHVQFSQLSKLPGCLPCRYASTSPPAHSRLIHRHLGQRWSESLLSRTLL